ncbi:MAG: nucleoside triphosphate pyrophosphohydrolase [Flavobacteriales bacterium]|nr:nucleoside triphosphate pyrophosphohydrolase [Flavobacteriales bacterium]PCH86626.1 MAG: nucleoside triphosphate pyrophosphohydrolase [Flavobacteriales bacterium]
MKTGKPNVSIGHASKTPGEAFERLVGIMDELRVKCPWDQKQTIESISHLTIEETYELVDSILDKDMDNIKKELGDLMLHIVFYSRIASETNDFNVIEVLDGICDKLIYRHPHIYGDVKAETPEKVKENWEKLKMKEGRSSVLESVPKSLPSLVKATRIQDKAKAVGFDWENKEQVWDKVNEELAELKAELDKEDNQERAEEELGDFLFSLINYCRYLKINPDNALERTNKKFIQRFQYLEKEAKASGKDLQEMTLEEMDKYWVKAKEIE